MTRDLLTASDIADCGGMTPERRSYWAREHGRSASRLLASTTPSKLPWQGCSPTGRTSNAHRLRSSICGPTFAKRCFRARPKSGRSFRSAAMTMRCSRRLSRWYGPWSCLAIQPGSWISKTASPPRGLGTTGIEKTPTPHRQKCKISGRCVAIPARRRERLRPAQILAPSLTFAGTTPAPTFPSVRRRDRLLA